MYGTTNTSPHRSRLFLLSVALIAVYPVMSAFAFDCKLAATKFEKAICADPAALAADAALGAAYTSLRNLLVGGQRSDLAKAQSRWVLERDANCGDKSGPDLSACLANQSKARMTVLLGAPVAGPGSTGQLVPFFRIEKGAAGKTNVDVEVIKFANPTTAGDHAFNADVEKLISDIPQPDKADKTEDYSFSALMTLSYASRHLISAQTITSTFVGGAHPMTEITNINIDIATGSEAKFANLLDEKPAKEIFKLCAAQVLQQKKEREGADADVSATALQALEQTVADVSGDLALWSFNEDNAVITYSADVVASHAEGVFDCTIPYVTLRKLAKASFPLP